jgi:hypothetical protein
MKAKILIIGIDPFLIDFSSQEYAAFPGLTPEKVTAGIEGSVNQLNELGYDAEKCWIDFDGTAVAVIQEKLHNTIYQGVLIGAGLRVPATNFILFEKLINLLHEKAPKAKIFFNTNPRDIVEAVQRWV